MARTKAKKTTLPKSFDAVLASGDIAALEAVFATCEIDARATTDGATALLFEACPDAFVRWLVANGADVLATDKFGKTALHRRARRRGARLDVLFELGCSVDARDLDGNTPLHAAAAGYNEASIAAIIARGATVGATNDEGLTPLELGLRGCVNAAIERMVPVAEALLAAGATRSENTRRFVVEIGRRFELHRDRMTPELLATGAPALAQLYALFDAVPVAPRQMHDGSSPIEMKSARWQEQHRELWDRLVPGSGAAPTVQGEVVRIAGRISDEVFRNGGGNWDADYRAMATAFRGHVATGVALTSGELSELEGIIVALPAERGLARLTELAVKWVSQNPMPRALASPSYRR